MAGGPAGYLVRRTLGPPLTLKLLRDAEFEADQLALVLVASKFLFETRVRPGYDPLEFMRLPRKKDAGFLSC